jgi:hypothetical protein
VRLALLIILAVSSAASAQPSQEVTRAFQAGVDAFRLGKLDEARKHLARAKNLDPKLPGPHRFLAAVAQAQGRFADCVASARIAIELNPVSQELADTRKLHDDCRRAAGRPAYSQELGDKAAIGVTANVAGATVKISGLVYGATPLDPRPIPAGAHEIELTKTGYLPAKRTVTALAGIVTDVEAELAPDPSAEGPVEVGSKVVPRAMGMIFIAGRHGGEELWLDGKPATDAKPITGGYRIVTAPGPHVIEVRSPGNDPWRRRVVVAADRGALVDLTLVDTARRERTRTKGLWLTGAGVGFIALGAVTLGIGVGRDEAVSRRTFYGLAGGSLGLGAVLLVFGVVDLSRGQRPDLTAPPPLAVIPVEGGVIASTGLVF